MKAILTRSAPGYLDISILIGAVVEITKIIDAGVVEIRAPKDEKFGSFSGTTLAVRRDEIQVIQEKQEKIEAE